MFRKGACHTSIKINNVKRSFNGDGLMCIGTDLGVYINDRGLLGEKRGLKCRKS